MRKKDAPALGFKTPFYPWFPIIALVLSFLCLIAIIWYNLILSMVFFAGLIVVAIIFVITGKHKQLVDDAFITAVEAAIV